MNELLNNINNSLLTLDSYIQQTGLSYEEWPFKGIKKVLILLKYKTLEGKVIETRLLRAMKDIYVVSFRNFEGTELNTEIKNTDDTLRNLYSGYEKLKPLGMDFGKGDPI